MPWRPEDWEGWLESADPDLRPDPVSVRVLQDILRRIPGRRRKTVADIGCGSGARLPFLVGHFATVVAVDPSAGALDAARRDHAGLPVEFRRRDLRDLASLGGRVDVAVAADSIVGERLSDLDRILSQVHACLVEGGIFVVTVPAHPKSLRPVPLPLGRRHPGGSLPLIHEVEMQYRLRRAGFEGVRVRRFGREGDRAESLLAMAVRRAMN